MKGEIHIVAACEVTYDRDLEITDKYIEMTTDTVLKEFNRFLGRENVKRQIIKKFHEDGAKIKTKNCEGTA